MNQDAPLHSLLDAVGRGQQTALRAIYDRESARMFGVAVAILRDRGAASDAMQTAFLRIWERAIQFDSARGDARAWLMSIVRHAALDIVRARGRELPTDDPALGDTAVEADAVERLIAAEAGSRLHSCLAQLEPEIRHFIVLAFVHGLSHAQIAAKLARPLGSLKSWIRRGLLSLRECLS